MAFSSLGLQHFSECQSLSFSRCCLEEFDELPLARLQAGQPIAIDHAEGCRSEDKSAYVGGTTLW